MNNSGYFDEDIIRAFQETHGNYAKAAALLGVTRGNLWLRVSNSPELKEAREQAARALIDNAEDKLVDMVIKGVDIHGSPVDAALHFKALQYFLSSKGKKRGYEGGGHRRPDNEANGSMRQREWMFNQMDVLADAIEKGGPPIQEVVDND